MESVTAANVLTLIGEPEENLGELLEKLKRERDALTQKIRQLKEKKQKRYSPRKLDEISKIVENMGQLTLNDPTVIREKEILISELSKQLEEMALDEGNENVDEPKIKRMRTNETDENHGNEMGKTILLLGNTLREMMILSQNRKEWLKVAVKPPSEKLSSYFGACFLNGELYIIEGYSTSLHKLNQDMEWISLAKMNVKRTEIINSCLEFNGHIWVLGGCGEGHALKSVERYDPQENKWTEMPSMKYGRWHAAAAACHGKIIICGGIGDTGYQDFLSSVECFDSESGVWIELAGLPSPIYRHSLVSCRNKVIILGGKGKTTCVKSVWELDPRKEQGKWKKLPSLKYKCFDMIAVTLEEKIYVVGGYGLYSSITKRYQRLERVEILEKDSPIRNYWQEEPPLSEYYSYDSAVIIPQNFADRLCKYNP